MVTAKIFIDDGEDYRTYMMINPTIILKRADDKDLLRIETTHSVLLDLTDSDTKVVIYNDRTNNEEIIMFPTNRNRIEHIIKTL